MSYTHCARKWLVTALLLGASAASIADERLDAAKAAYDQAFEHYTKLVTTEAGTGDVLEALEEYKQAHIRYMTLRNSSPPAPAYLDTTGIKGIESIELSSDAPADKTVPAPLAALKEQVQAGDAQAMELLSITYRTGYAEQADPYQAIDLLKKSAKAGNANAMASLANAYEAGLWIKQDKNKATTLREQAAKQGSRLAEWELESHE